MMKSVGLVLLLALVGCGSSELEVAPDAEGRDGEVTADFGRLSSLAPPETSHWGQLAGVWDCLVSTPGEDGVPVQSRAKWTWRYVLDGHAVQDVYEGLRADASPSFFGTGLRIYHPASAEWEISWAANSPPNEASPRITRFTATSEERRIVMRRANDDLDWRTVFDDISEESFAWFSEPSGQRMKCRRFAG